MRFFQKLAVAYLVSVVLIGYGYSISRYHVFPYHQILQFENFATNDGSTGQLSVAEKIANDLDIVPTRAIVKHPLNPERRYSEVQLPRAKARRLPPLVYHAPGASPGYRLIFGMLDFKDGLHGAVLLDDKDRVINTWTVTEDDLNFKSKADTNKSPHDISILADGSIIFAYMFGSSIQRIDWCGNRIWAARGVYHHNFSLADDGSLWALRKNAVKGDEGLVQLDVNDGRVLRVISFKQIMAANPGIDIFGIRQKDKDDSFEWAFDYWHENDVDVLNSRLAPSFEQFSEGDLLVSFRSLNLIFVVDPDDLKVKWWRSGVTRRQHDPDWQPDGTISIYDNNTHRGISRIVKIDPLTYEVRVIYSGEAENFYSDKRGNHQILDNGNILIVVSEQGRLLEVNAAGETVYEFINRYREGENLKFTDAVYIPQTYLDLDKLGQCERREGN